MNEEKTIQPGATTSMPVEAAPGEKHSAVIVRGISMPPHQVRMAVDQAVARELWSGKRMGECAFALRLDGYETSILQAIGEYPESKRAKGGAK